MFESLFNSLFKSPVVWNKVSLGLPFGLGNVEFVRNETQVRAAWSLYVELVTRIAVQPLTQDEGLYREALNSLYSLFATTREILKEAGPSVGASQKSVGGLAIAVLNKGLRPFLAKWHPRLQDWETQRLSAVSPKVHELNWSEVANFQAELTELRENLIVYAKALAAIAGVEE